MDENLEPIVIHCQKSEKWWENTTCLQDLIDQFNIRFKFLPNGEIEKR